MTHQARKLFKEGVDAFAQDRWADARAAFLAALSLNPHYTIRGNLGASELKLGRYRDAAEHLASYVREMAEDTTSTAAERERGAAMYAEARTKVGTLVVRVDVDGARVFVDGTWRGMTPLADPLFVEPGTHTISLEHEGYETTKMTVQLGAGGEIKNRMELQRKSAGAPPPKPLDTTMAPPTHSAEQHAAGPRTALLIGGAATAGAAAVAGLVFTLVAAAKGSDAGELRDSIVREHGAAACSRPDAPSAACADLNDAFAVHRRWTNAAFWSFAGAGAIGAGTLIYGLSTKPSTRREGALVTPLVGANCVGISVAGVL